MGIFLVLLLAVSLSVPAFAADGESGGGIDMTFFKSLFVPAPNYFYNKVQQLNEKVNEKFGGLAYLYQMLDNFFTTLKNPPASSALAVSMPDNFLYKGYRGFKYDLFGASVVKPYVSMLRKVFTGFCCLLTGIACYHKLRTFLSEGAGG